MELMTAAMRPTSLMHMLVVQVVLLLPLLLILLLLSTTTTTTATTTTTSWRFGVVASVVRRMNEVTVHWARLVLGWVTVFGRVYHHGV